MFKNIKSIQEVYNGSDMFSEIDNNIYFRDDIKYF